MTQHLKPYRALLKIAGVTLLGLCLVGFLRLPLVFGHGAPEPPASRTAPQQPLPDTILYGQAFVGNESAPAGLAVSASCYTFTVMTTTFKLNAGPPPVNFSLFVPNDDPSTKRIEGCSSGQPLTFKIACVNATASEPGTKKPMTVTWQAASFVNVDLTAKQRVTVPKLKGASCPRGIVYLPLAVSKARVHFVATRLQRD